MKIKHRFRFVDGDMDTETDELLCVGKRKYGEVHLCVKSNMHIPIAQIRLHSEDRAVEAAAVFEDAEKLGDEIARRWNQAAALEKENFEQSDLIARLEAENKIYQQILDGAIEVRFVDPEIVFERDCEGDGRWRFETWKRKLSGFDTALEAFNRMTKQEENDVKNRMDG
jgi:hypothetical protein